MGNGGPGADQRAAGDNGFLELPRLGVLPPDDPDVLRSLQVTAPVLSRTTSAGTGVYRYGTAAAGTEDGYGDCNVGDSTDCTVQGKPWAGTCDAQGQNKGSGHLWPVLAGEKAENLLARGNEAGAARLWVAMADTASGVGLIPEQAWENADLPPSPYGTPPERAGPGTYAYPTAGDFHDGAYDLQQFQVYDSGPDTVTFRVRTRDLTPTFGSALGAQLLDLHVNVPGGGATSTAAARLRHRPVEPADRGPGLRPAVRRRAGPHPRCRPGQGARHHPVHHVHGDQAGARRDPRTGLDLRAGAGRPGRVQPGRGPRLHRDPTALHVRRVRAGRDREPDLRGGPRHGGRGDGRADAARGRPGGRAGPTEAPVVVAAIRLE